MKYKNPLKGFVRFRIELYPHDPGANGEEYTSGELSAYEVVLELRRIANRVELDWINQECCCRKDSNVAI